MMQSRKVIQGIQLDQTVQEFDVQQKKLESIIDEYKILTATLAKMTNLHDIRNGMTDAADIRRRMAACATGILPVLKRCISLMVVQRRTKRRQQQIAEMMAYQARYTTLITYISETNPIISRMGTQPDRVTGNTCANQELEELYRMLPALRPIKPKRQR